MGGIGTTSGSALTSGTRRYWDYNIDRTISEATLSPTGTIGELKVISRTFEQFADFSVYKGTNEPDLGGAKGARRMISLTEGYGSSEARVTQYTYVVAPSNPNVHGRLQSRTNPDGSWESYEYSDSQNTSLAVETKWSSWKNLPIANKANARKTVTTIEKSKTTSVTSVAGQTISKRETLLTNLPNGQLLTTTRDWDGNAWHEHVSCRYPQNNDTLLSGRIKWIKNPDGIATLYTYATAPNGYNGYNVTESTGAATLDGSGYVSAITRGTRTVSNYNVENTEIARDEFDIVSGLQLSAWINSDLDNKGRPQRTDFPLDGTYEIAQYSCCGLGYSLDRTGASRFYSRDPLKRVYLMLSRRSSTGSEIFDATTYDGLTQRETRSVGATTLLLRETTRNLAGEIISMKSPDANGDAIPETTTLVTTFPSGGGKSVSTTFPDASTSIRTTFADGQEASISGTAVIAKTYDHGTHALNGGGTWSQSIAANSTEWVKTFSDPLGRTFRTEAPDGAVSTSTYFPTTAAPGSRGKLASSIDPDAVSISYTYDAEGALAQTTEAMPANQQRLTTFGNDVVNDPTIGVSTRRTTTLNGVLVATSLSQTLGHASKIIALTGTSTISRSVPADGAWTTTSVAADGVSRREFYSDGLMKASVTFAAGASLPTAAPSDIATVADAGFIHGSSVTQDGFGRILSQRDSRTGTTTMGTILENGSYASITEPGNLTTTYTYDVMGRTTAKQLPDSSITHTRFTARGEIQAQWGSQTYPIIYTYDAQGRVKTLRTQPTLDSGGAPTNAGGNLTTWNYHPQRGTLSSKRDATNKGASYTYTAAGRLATRIWERGITTTYSYDAGMLTLTDYSDATPDVTQTYDPFGRAAETSNTVSTTTFAYNPATLVLASETIVLDLNADGTPDLTRVIDRSQDTLLRTTGFELKNAATVENLNSYTYDTAGRLATVGSAPVSGAPLGVPPNVFTYDYTPNSKLLASVTGPAHTVTHSWESGRDVLSMKENRAGATVVSNYLYSVNSIAQRTELSQTGSAFTAARSIAWGYDSLGQVTSADSSIPGLDRAYLFDTIGNRIKSADSLTLPTNPNYITNSLNQYTAVNSVIPSYDGDGNMTSGPLASQPTANSTLTWDGENRLIQATLPDTNVVNFQYDSQSRRIAKSSATGTTLYVYDAWNPIAEYAISGGGAASISRTYLWGDDLSGTLQGAGGVGGLLAVTLNNQPSTPSYFPTYDGNGNVSEYLDATGSIVAHYEYDPFGRTTVATGAMAVDFSHRFSTKPLETQTGLYYYGYRYYDPATGRWPSRDPIGERGGINLYVFCANSPSTRWDSLGLIEGPIDDVGVPPQPIHPPDPELEPIPVWECQVEGTATCDGEQNACKKSVEATGIVIRPTLNRAREDAGFDAKDQLNAKCKALSKDESCPCELKDKDLKEPKCDLRVII